MKQSFTSRNTSINSKKLPAVYNRAEKHIHGKVLDYGCGKYTALIEAHAKAHGFAWTGYDKFNQTAQHNAHTFRKADVVISSNVLNVIKEKEVRADVLQKMAKRGNKLLIMVYEGDKSGKGRRSQADCWQENRKTADYLAEVEQATGYKAHVENGVIVAEKI